MSSRVVCVSFCIFNKNSITHELNMIMTDEEDEDKDQEQAGMYVVCSPNIQGFRFHAQKDGSSVIP